MLKCGIARIASLRGGGEKGVARGMVEQKGCGPDEESQKECGACRVTMELTRGRVPSPLSWPVLKYHTLRRKIE